MCVCVRTLLNHFQVVEQAVSSSFYLSLLIRFRLCSSCILNKQTTDECTPVAAIFLAFSFGTRAPIEISNRNIKIQYNMARAGQEQKIMRSQRKKLTQTKWFQINKLVWYIHNSSFWKYTIRTYILFILYGRWALEKSSPNTHTHTQKASSNKFNVNFMNLKLTRERKRKSENKDMKKNAKISWNTKNENQIN